MHEITGIFQNIDLYDEIEIFESSLDSVDILNHDIAQEDNLVYKTLKLIKNELSIKDSLKLKSIKIFLLALDWEEVHQMQQLFMV